MLIIITGHYGSGKTNVAVNLAFKLKNDGFKVTIVDMDIVNPYFRTADSVDEFDKMGIKYIIPQYANSNIDIPALPAEIYSTFNCNNADEYVIYDVGGDDDGATVLAVYKQYFDKCGYEMWCVCNMYRPLISDPVHAGDLIFDINRQSRLTCTGIINNSNLGIETTDEIFTDSFPYIDEISRITELPVICQTAMSNILPDNKNIFHIKNVTKNIYGGHIDE